MNPELLSAFHLLRKYPAFGRFWIGALASQLGDFMAFIALPWFVLQSTGSGTATAGILLALQLPAVATGMVAGSLIDRYQPRWILALDNGLRAAIVALIPLLYWVGWLPLWLLFLLTIVAGMLKPATTIGARTILPELVADEDLDGANMLWAFSINLSVVAGPALAGLLVASFGSPFVLLLDAVTFVIMALVSLSLPVMQRKSSATHESMAARFGLRQLWQIKVVRITTLLSLVFFCSYGPLEAALPLYSQDVLMTDARGYGLLWTALGVGALLGTLGSAALSRRLRLGLALPTIAVLWGLALTPLLFTDQLWVACCCLLAGGIAWGPYTPMETTLLQRTVPKAELGRVFGARTTLLTSGAPLGLAVGGALLTVVPPTALIALSSLACMAVGVAGLASPALRSVALVREDQADGLQRTE